MDINEKLAKAREYIGKSMKVILVQPSGQTYLQDATLKSAWILKDLILVDFNELGNYITNIDLVGVLNENRFDPVV